MPTSMNTRYVYTAIAMLLAAPAAAQQAAVMQESQNPQTFSAPTQQQVLDSQGMVVYEPQPQASGFYTPGAALDVMQQGDVLYVSGGVGKEETDALKAMQKDFNLKVGNNDVAGHYSGDVNLIIRDSKNAVLLDMKGGPMIYAKLPAGRYVVEAINGADSKKQTVTIRNGKTSAINFVWPEELN